MAPKFEPFAHGPKRPKKVISLGMYRTGSQSLKEALTILGYQNVFHSSAIVTEPAKWLGLEMAADANIACLPSYTGESWTRKDWDEYFGPCEALTDVTPFAQSLLMAYPEAQIILVKRDFESWADSFLKTLIIPSSTGLLAWLSGNVFESLIGLRISQSAWKMYMGLVGVCRLKKTRDRRILRTAHHLHHDAIRRMVPKEKLLELDLKDLSWEPLCQFLDKGVPGRPFPRLNESRVFQNEFVKLHRAAIFGGLLKVLMPLVIIGVGISSAIWLAKRNN